MLGARRWAFARLPFLSTGLCSTLRRPCSSPSVNAFSTVPAARPLQHRGSLSGPSFVHEVSELKSLPPSDLKVRRTLANAVAELVPSNQAALQLGDVARILSGLARHAAFEEARSLLATLPAHIVPARGNASAKEFALCLHGLRGFKSETPGATALLGALIPWVTSCTERVGARSLSMALYGLRGFSSEHPEVRSLLCALTLHVQRCKEPLDAQAVGTALYGLQRCSSQHAEFRSLLRALAPHIEHCEELDAQAVSNALYGLHGCSSEHSEVCSVVSALAPHIERCKEPLSVQQVSSAFYGLQGCSSEHAEVRHILLALGSHVKRSKELDAQAIGNTLYGLHGCSSEHSEVRLVLEAVALQIERCRESLRAQHVGNALFGLQGCSTDHSEVRSVLKALTSHVEHCTETLSVQAIGNALFGLQGCSTVHPEVRSVLATLAPQIGRCKEPLNAEALGNALWGLQSFKPDYQEPFIFLVFPQSLSEVLMRDMSSQSDAGLTSLVRGCAALMLQRSGSRSTQPPVAGDAVSRLSNTLEAASSELTSRVPRCSGTGQVDSGAAVLARAKSSFVGHPFITVRPSACFLHGFEASVVIDVRPTRGGEPVMFNVEVDGPTHSQHSKQRLVSVRDAHLKARGVRVLRWDLQRDGRSGPSFDAWLQREVGSEVAA